MDIVIAGGHGKVPRLLSRRLDLMGDRVRALIRNAAHNHDVEAAGAEPVICDLEQVDDDVLAARIASDTRAVPASSAADGCKCC
jgi:uncharacterized protein YbjT (DUF2867 family)